MVYVRLPPTAPTGRRPFVSPTTTSTTVAQKPPSTCADLDRLYVMPHSGDDLGGHDSRSSYVETFWLPLLGPSTTLLLRRLADGLDDSPDGFEVDCLALSREIGLGRRMGRGAPFVRTVERCVRFSMARLDGDLLYVRRRLPPLGPRRAQQLSPRLQQLHDSWDAPTSDGDPAQRRAQMVRATELARSLLRLGEPAHQVERQLETWRFDPGIVWSAVQWAQSGHPSLT